MVKKSEAYIDLYPTKANLYYYAGKGNNNLKNYKKAKDVLESGIDFIIDDTVLEINFNLQLGEASNGLGDMKKKDLYFSKANQLIEKQKRK